MLQPRPPPPMTTLSLPPTGSKQAALRGLLQVGPPGSGHDLRLQGFVAFEAAESLHDRVRATFRNPPEVAHSLRLVLRSEAGGWQRDVPLTHSTGGCEYKALHNPKADVDACFARASNNTGALLHPSEFGLNLGSTDSPDFHLLVAGWPRRANLRRQLQLALRAPPADTEGPPFPVVRPLPYLRSVPAAAVARILAWQEQYYAPLGLSGTVLYVLPKELLDLEEQRDIQQLVAAGRLTLVLWDELAWYKVGVPQLPLASARLRPRTAALPLARSMRIRLAACRVGESLICKSF